MLRARWVTLRARWVTRRARWVTLRARWVTLRARWVTLRARWVTLGAGHGAVRGADAEDARERAEVAHAEHDGAGRDAGERNSRHADTVHQPRCRRLQQAICVLRLERDRVPSAEVLCACPFPNR
jgi:hypothetical protein